MSNKKEEKEEKEKPKKNIQYYVNISPQKRCCDSLKEAGDYITKLHDLGFVRITMEYNQDVK